MQVAAVEPTPAQLLKLAKAIVTGLWDMRRADDPGARNALEAQFNDTSRQIDTLLDRIMNASSQSVIGADETRIERLARAKIRPAEPAGSAVQNGARLGELIEPAMAFVASLQNICRMVISPAVERCLNRPLQRHSGIAGTRGIEPLKTPCLSVF